MPLFFWETPLFAIGETSVSLFSILLFCLILGVSFLSARLISRSIRTPLHRFLSLKNHLSSSNLYRLSRLCYYLILGIGTYIALTAVGIDLTTITVIVGAFSVGIGFCLQAIFSNFIAGIILLTEQKISLGDYIALDAQTAGTVVRIDIRSTTLRCPQGQSLLIPNGQLLSQRVTIWRSEPAQYHLYTLLIQVKRTLAQNQVQADLLTIARQTHPISESAPTASLYKLTEDEQSWRLHIPIVPVNNLRLPPPWQSDPTLSQIVNTIGDRLGTNLLSVAIQDK